jgi:SAM-dependent methyltransferase
MVLSVQATSPSDEPHAAWSRYWKAGHEHSCPTSFDGFYGPQLQAFWRRQAALLGPEDVLLDLGCGNGALLRFLWLQFAPDRAPRLVGVDAADLRSDWLRGPISHRVTVHAGKRFDSLPLADGSVSFAASLFGIEYGASEAAWSELQRVLRPRARVAFVLHKRGSHLDAVAADDILVCRAALAPDGVLALAHSMVPYLIVAATEEGRASLRTDRSAEAARARYNAATTALVDLSQLVKHGHYAHDILGAVNRVLAGAAAGLGAVIGQRLDALRASIEDHLARITGLRESALDSAALDAMRQRLGRAGFSLAEPATIAEQGHEMGWALEGEREHG